MSDEPISWRDRLDGSCSVLRVGLCIPITLPFLLRRSLRSPELRWQRETIEHSPRRDIGVSPAAGAL